MRSFLVLVICIAFACTADAGGKFRLFARKHQGANCSVCASCPSGACSSGACAVNACANGQCVMPSPALVPVPVEPKKETKVKVKAKGKHAALDQLNEQRAQRGLPPYALDEGLQAAAEQCAQIRAASFIHGHLPTNHQFPLSDFSLLQGVECACTGAGANTPDWGFTACECYGHYTFAGAAGVMGDDGRYYCSLYLR